MRRALRAPPEQRHAARTGHARRAGAVPRRPSARRHRGSAAPQHGWQPSALRTRLPPSRDPSPRGAAHPGTARPFAAHVAARPAARGQVGQGRRARDSPHRVRQRGRLRSELLHVLRGDGPLLPVDRGGVGDPLHARDDHRAQGRSEHRPGAGRDGHAVPRQHAAVLPPALSRR